MNDNHEDNDDDDYDNLFNDCLKSKNLLDENLELCCALLASFFSGRMTQHALTVQLKLLNIVLEDALPNSFNELRAKNHLDDKIDFEKTWFCNKCKLYVVPVENKQRLCLVCKDRFINVIYIAIQKDLLFSFYL